MGLNGRIEGEKRFSGSHEKRIILKQEERNSNQEEKAP